MPKDNARMNLSYSIPRSKSTRDGDNDDLITTLSIEPCLNAVLELWNLFICLGVECLINHVKVNLIKPEIFFLWIRACCCCWCLEYSRVKHNLEDERKSYYQDWCVSCSDNGVLIFTTFDRVLAFDLIESERSPPKFFTAPVNKR